MTSPAHRSTRRAHAPVRSAILAVATLAVVGVLFAVYQYSTGIRPTPDEPGRAAETPPADERPAGPEEPTRTVPVGDGQLGPGERPKIVLYGPEKKEARAEIVVSDYEPSRDADDELHLFEPEIRLRTPNGQELRVAAEEGWVQVLSGDSRTPEPRSGRLVGHVTIDVDRLSDQQRAALPPDQRHRLDEDRLIHLEFDEIQFHLEESRLDAAGNFSLHMAEASLEGAGLHLRYNEVDSRVELLLIERLDELVFWAPRATLDASIPGTTATVLAPPPDAADRANSVAATPVTPPSAVEHPAEPQDLPPASPGESDDIPLFVPDRPSEPKVWPRQTYRVEIDRDVSVRQMAADEAAWNLEAPTVELLFDFGQRQREAARQGKVAEPGSPDDGSSPTGPTETSSQAQIVVHCAGAFSLRPVATPDSDETETGDRLRLTAGDGDVHFTDGGSSVSCFRLTAQQDTGTIRLVGAENAPVMVKTADGSELVAADVFVDRRAGTARITGPARIVGGRRDDEPSVGAGGVEPTRDGMYIQFDDPADLTLATHVLRRVNPTTNRIEAIKVEYIAEAVFSGNVKLERGGELIAADLITATFDPPSRPGTFAERIHSLEAHGDVLMRRGQEHVTCSDLSVLFGQDPDGDTVPRFAEAVGNVVITQGTLTITADDYVNLEMAPVLRVRPPFDAAQARLDAMARGLDPADFDVEAARRDYEGKLDYTTGLARLTAQGDVTVLDPDQNLDLAAEELACDFADGRRLRAAHLVGPQGRPAFVQFADFTVEAHELDVDFDAQRVDVLGQGQLSFMTYRGLDGNRSETPQHVTVSWRREMTFRGDRNAARFSGGVHATTKRRFTPAPTLLSRLGLSGDDFIRQTSSFDADELLIDFAETEPDADRPDTAQWWIFTPLAQRWDEDPTNRSNAFNKEAVYLLASRNVVGLFTNTDADTGRIQNRVRVESQKLAVDLRSELMTIPTAGNLLIEDYQTTVPAGDGESSSNRLFGGGLSGLPSQSFIQWARSMSFHFGASRADFRENVKLIHRTGEQMVFASGLVPADDQSDRPDRGTPGRRTQLECQSLVAEFSGRAADTPRADRSAGRLSVRDIRQLDATGGVLLLDDEITITAYRIVKFPQSDLLRVFGTEDADAEIYGTGPGGPRFQGPEFSYHLVTGQIEAAGRHRFHFYPQR